MAAGRLLWWVPALFQHKFLNLGSKLSGHG